MPRSPGGVKVSLFPSTGSNVTGDSDAAEAGLSAWNTDPDGPPDFDGNGSVGLEDLLTVLTNWT